jgi:hypothetical protein
MIVKIKFIVLILHLTNTGGAKAQQHLLLHFSALWESTLNYAAAKFSATKSQFTN